MQPQEPTLAQISFKLDLLMSRIDTGPEEWLTPQDVQRIFKIGKTKFWELVGENAFPIYRMEKEEGKQSRCSMVKRSEVVRFLEYGFPKSN